MVFFNHVLRMLCAELFRTVRLVVPRVSAFANSKTRTLPRMPWGTWTAMRSMAELCELTALTASRKIVWVDCVIRKSVFSMLRLHFNSDQEHVWEGFNKPQFFFPLLLCWTPTSYFYCLLISSFSNLYWWYVGTTLCLCICLFLGTACLSRCSLVGRLKRVVGDAFRSVLVKHSCILITLHDVGYN